MAPPADDRIQAISGALERERTRRELLAGKVDDVTGRLTARVDELTRRLDRLELRVLVLAAAGSLGGTVIGTAGTAFAEKLFGG